MVSPNRSVRKFRSICGTSGKGPWSEKRRGRESQHGAAGWDIELVHNPVTAGMTVLYQVMSFRM